jgi:protein-S-isoprenylcysteine O-methyltransferase Ste14
MTASVAKAIFLVFVIAWLVVRVPHQRRASRRRPRVSGLDTRDRILQIIAVAGLGVVPIFYVATHFPRAADYPFLPVLGWIGVGLLLLAFWVNWRVHQELGANFSPTLTVYRSHALVTTGIYAHVRHPMYSAFWLWALAQPLLLPNAVAGFSGLIGFAIFFFLRVGREEDMMCAAFGDEYRAYMVRTARVIPGVY